MASRASTAAAVILLVSLAVIFILVGNSGVSTAVYVAGQPTSTPAPTLGPSPTPLPDPAVENWQETAPGQLIYLPRPDSSAQVFYSVMTLDEFASGLGVEPPSADAPYPQLSVLESMRDGFEEQIAELGLNAGLDALDGPAIELVNGVPFSRLRVQLDAQESASSGSFPGLDLVIGIFDRPGDEIQLVQYRLQETPDPAIYQDFRAWLEAKAVELSGGESEADTAEGTEEPADAEATEEPTEEPTQEATAEPAPETTETETDAAATEEAAAPAAGDETAAAGPWTEVMPGVLMYSGASAVVAQIAYQSMPVAEFTEGSGLDTPEAGAESPMVDLLAGLRETLSEQLTSQGLSLTEDAFAGPEAITLAGKPAARLRLVAAPESLASGQPFPGLDIVIILVELPDDQLAAIQYTYQGAPDASVYAEFETWLDENADRATEPAVVEEQLEDTVEEATEEAEGD